MTRQQIQYKTIVKKVKRQMYDLFESYGMNSFDVYISNHFVDRMFERNINFEDILPCLDHIGRNSGRLKTNIKEVMVKGFVVAYSFDSKISLTTCYRDGEKW